jgi:hypothetical protein
MDAITRERGSADAVDPDGFGEEPVGEVRNLSRLKWLIWLSTRECGSNTIGADTGTGTDLSAEARKEPSSLTRSLALAMAATVGDAVTDPAVAVDLGVVGTAAEEATKDLAEGVTTRGAAAKVCISSSNACMSLCSAEYECDKGRSRPVATKKYTRARTKEGHETIRGDKQRANTLDCTSPTHPRDSTKCHVRTRRFREWQRRSTYRARR